MTRYRLDSIKGRVIAFECFSAAELDDKQQQQYENTHFYTHAEALAALVKSLRYQVQNAAVRFGEAARVRRKARRELARVTSILVRLGGIVPP